MEGAGLTALPFWERPDVVERFAARPPDNRMVELLTAAPRQTRVLDLACAGGRNAEWLARQGFDFYACDNSPAMVARTRSRVAPILGTVEAERHVIPCRMEDLSVFASGFFDVVLAFGVYQQAGTVGDWHGAVSETVRVLRTGGQVLVQHFSPRSVPAGESLRRLDEHVFEAPDRDLGRMVLLDPDELDAWMRRHGLTPLSPPRAATSPTEQGGYWINVHACYARA